MKSNFVINLKKFLLTNIIKYFRYVNWYETDQSVHKLNIKKIRKNNLKLLIFNSKKQVSKSSIEMHGYFKRYKEKLKRFSKKNYFLVLTNKSKKKGELLCCLWVNYHPKNKHYIQELDVYVDLKKQYLIYDGETPDHLRGNGYFTFLMQMARYKFKNKKVISYVLSTHPVANEVNKKAGSGFVRKMYGY